LTTPARKQKEAPEFDFEEREFLQFINPIWRIYDEQNELALGKEDIFMVVTDTIEEICQKYKAKEDTL